MHPSDQIGSMFGGTDKDTRQLAGDPAGNDDVQVYALDKPEPDGASHVYVIKYKDNFNLAGNSALQVNFQRGSIPTVGINGISDEALLAIIIDRAESFAACPYAKDENAQALQHLQEAMKCRTAARAKSREERGAVQ